MLYGILKLWCRRFKNKFKYLFNLRSFFWEFQSCDDCGHCYRISWWIKDEVWKAVVGNLNGGSFCLDCFIERAEQKNISFTLSDFEWLAIFSKSKPFSELRTDDIIVSKR